MTTVEGNGLDPFDPDRIEQGFRFFKMIVDGWRALGFGRLPDRESTNGGDPTIDDYRKQLMHARVEGQRQSNELDMQVANVEMQAIRLAAMAAINTDPEADPLALRRDWFRYFANSSAVASTEVDIQFAFAKLLAGETNRAGSYSRLTMDILAKMETRHARTLQTLRSFSALRLRTAAQMLAMDPNEPRIFVPLVFELNAPIFMNEGLSFDALRELEALGILSVGAATNTMSGPSRFVFAYPTSHIIDTPGNHEGGLESGHVLPSYAGYELLNLCTPKSVDGFVDYVSDKWRSHGHEVSYDLNDVITIGLTTDTPP